MVNIEHLIESNYISVAQVSQSDKKELTIISSGGIEIDKFGNERLVLLVEFNGKQKQWKLNKATLEKLSGAYGNLTDAWLGKVIELKVEKLGEMDAVVGYPKEIKLA